MSVTTDATGSTPSLLISQNVIGQTALLIVLGCLSHLTMTAGFDAEASSIITNIRHGIYIIVRLVASITLVWQCALGYGRRKRWIDILETEMWVAGAGATISFAT
jgi:hypothetical protein